MAIPRCIRSRNRIAGNVNPIGPRACYDEGKRAAETLFMDYHRMNRVNVRIVRIFNTYGPRMHPFDGRVISNFIRQALTGEPITIFGDGSQTRSFCYRDDLIEGIMRMMDGPDDFLGPVNLGNPGEFTIAELAEKVIELTGSKSKIVYRPLPADDPTRRRPDITLAQDKLNWSPIVSHWTKGCGARLTGFAQSTSTTIGHPHPTFDLAVAHLMDLGENDYARFDYRRRGFYRQPFCRNDAAADRRAVDLRR